MSHSTLTAGLYRFCGKCEGWDLVNRFNYNIIVAVVTPTDRLKLVGIRCVIEVLLCVFFFCFHVAFWIFPLVYSVCHRTDSDL